MRKVSTPGDRAYLEENIPVVMTKLEMMMPIDWNTTVIHLFTNHTIDTIKALGPFNAANILDIERFHTLFKSLARGKENVMASIKNHYLLLEVSLSARMSAEVDWTSLPAKSTPAGYAGRLDSEDKADRMCQPFGKVKCTTLTSDEYRLVQTLWADSYPIYKNLHRRYNVWVRQNRSSKNSQTFEKWLPRPAGVRNASAPAALTNEEKNWQKMTNEIKVARMLAHCTHTLFGFAYSFWLCVLFLALRTIFDFLCCIQYGVPFHLCACVAGVQEGPVRGEFLQNNAVSELFEDR